MPTSSDLAQTSVFLSNISRNKNYSAIESVNKQGYSQSAGASTIIGTKAGMKVFFSAGHWVYPKLNRMNLSGFQSKKSENELWGWGRNMHWVTPCIPVVQHSFRNPGACLQEEIIWWETWKFLLYFYILAVWEPNLPVFIYLFSELKHFWYKNHNIQFCSLVVD